MEIKLFCARCMINGLGKNNARLAVTIMSGDALCNHHMLMALQTRREAEARLRRIDDLETTGGSRG